MRYFNSANGLLKINAQTLAYVKNLEVLRGHRTGETAPPRRYVRTVVRITRFHTEKQINLLFLCRKSCIFQNFVVSLQANNNEKKWYYGKRDDIT